MTKYILFQVQVDGVPDDFCTTDTTMKFSKIIDHFNNEHAKPWPTKLSWFRVQDEPYDTNK